ncbi:MAG: glucose 1-dehydrogenase [Pseudomonadales bacterium]|jgi:NAD(P)-dependent dehydrogenase (short-subunit alcohol dehydrogenase family)|nr:glucose 1-dehydrogenase [Pseudomonadales bacterium]|tara:strand:+ start:213 stop:1037 length:825 start_codon:yes stop_codon:yes gene_type:complete
MTDRSIEQMPGPGQSRDGRLAGRTALVTGASRGIGRAIAMAFVREGAAVYLTARDDGRLRELESEILGYGGQVAVHGADLRDGAALEAMFGRARDWRGGLDVLVNNAGIYLARPFTGYTMAEFDGLMQTNVYPVFRLMQLALEHMAERGAGKIINMASTAGKWESPGQSAYNASKHAVVGLTRCAALEFAPSGVNVNAICPGVVDTDMFNGFEVHAEAAGMTMEEFRRSAESRIPMGRLLEADEVAHIAVYLASGESDGMTGQTITISGGMRMG